MRCSRCQRGYPIKDGILSFLEPEALDAEGANEMRIRDSDTEGYDRYISSLGTECDAETVPMLSELRLAEGASVLELGCGTGRYTLPILHKGGPVTGVDFSRQSLVALARKVPDGSPLALVHADITRLRATPRSFDRVTSTLVSNLPTDAAREALYALAAGAMTNDGYFVFSTHNYGLREWMRREAIEGPYNPEYLVFRKLFRPKQIEAEAAVHFECTETRRIAIVLPLTRQLGLPLLPISRFLEAVPVLNEWANLLLFTSTNPKVTPVTDATTSPQVRLRSTETEGAMSASA